MKVLDCNESDLISEFKENIPSLWNLIASIMTLDETRRHTGKFRDSLKVMGEHHGYFVINHMLKLIGGNVLVARAAMVGIFMETQGENVQELFMNI